MVEEVCVLKGARVAASEKTLTTTGAHADRVVEVAHNEVSCSSQQVDILVTCRLREEPQQFPLFISCRVGDSVLTLKC